MLTWCVHIWLVIAALTRLSESPSRNTPLTTGGSIHEMPVRIVPPHEDDLQTLGGWGHFVRFALYNCASMRVRGVADT